MMTLTAEHKAIAIAVAEYLRKEGYVLSKEEREELRSYREQDDEYINGIGAAKMIGCSPARITTLRKRGVLKYKMEGSVPRYSVKSIRKYNKSRAVNIGD